MYFRSGSPLAPAGLAASAVGPAARGEAFSDSGIVVFESRHAPEFMGKSAARVANYAARLKTEFYASVSLDDAARSVGLGRRRFTELFRQVVGESWRRYVHRLRLEYAAQLLVTTDRSVTSIAFECGFEELSHFHHSFKTAYGGTPLTYRSRARLKPESYSRAENAAIAS